MIGLEKYKAIVVAVDEEEDPPGYIRVACSGILEDEDTALPMAIAPAFDWGWFYIPDVGETVEIEVEVSSEQDESPSQFSIDNLNATWRNKRFHTSDETEEPTEPRPIPKDFTEKNYGKRRGFATPVGHIFLFDDTEGETKIYLTWVKEKDNLEDVSTILLDSDGSIMQSIFGGKHFAHLRENEHEVSLEEGKHKFLFKPNEVEVLLDEGAALKVTGKDGDTTTILGDGAVKAAIADHLKTLWEDNRTKHSDLHLHNSAFGPTDVATVKGSEWDEAIEYARRRIDRRSSRYGDSSTVSRSIMPFGSPILTNCPGSKSGTGPFSMPACMITR